ncbi:hypothetical protein Tco_0819241 [Tanacetum coccineum]|uniref:Uncharacterized protein n=1 Tax=Tanacetum coccineum TaxID=301880 RepID=A0ABQ5A8V7_9ASTR
MDNDLFTYEVEVTNIPCNSKIDDDSEHEADDDMGYDLSDVAFIEWLVSKNFNYKTMDHYTMNALWIYWIRRDDEVELTNKESYDDEDEICWEGLRPMMITKMTGSTNGIKMYHGCTTSHGLIMEYGKSQHQSNIRASLSIIRLDVRKWPTCSWRDDGYCNRGNLLGTYIIGNQLHYQDYEWYEALEDCELKNEAL